MAEALLRHFGGSRVTVSSAGSEPRPVHPLTLQTLRNLGVDAKGQRSKPVRELASQRFDYVITVCDRIREVCPTFPGHPERIHWSVPDPVSTRGGARAQRRAFEETAQQLTTRIRYLLMAIELAA
jgi:protein-tyrosine-phosphatase